MPNLIDTKIAEYWKTKDAIDALDAKAAPLIAERDALQAQFEPKLVELNQKIMAVRAPRYDLAMNLAFLAKALSGRVGERPASE